MKKKAATKKRVATKGISEFTVIETKGWKNPFSQTLFSTQLEAELDWAKRTFRVCVDLHTYGGEFNSEDFLEAISTSTDLRAALQILIDNK